MFRSMPTISRPTCWWHRYGISVLLVGLAIGIRVWPLNVLEARIPFGSFYPAVMLSGFIGGFGPGLTAAIGSVIVLLNWSPDGGPASLPNLGGWPGVGLFLVNAIVIAVITEAMNRAKHRAELAREAAEVANRSKSVFLANMSHELRTPLNAIIGFSQILGNDELLHKKARKQAFIINRSGGHLLNMINEILDLSKIEAGRFEKQDNAFRLSQLVLEIDELLRLRAEVKGLVMVVALDDDSDQCVVTDQGKLRQILINLVGNAIKFTNHGGVTVRFRIIRNPEAAFDCWLDLEVIDSGPGIPESQFTYIFEPFAQLGDGDLSQKGTGLGLSITQAFARLLGGEVTVTSTVGIGSCFQVRLPVRLAAVEQKSPVKQRTIIALADGEPECRILAVDDHQDNRDLLKTLLEDAGFKVQTACNGLECLSIAQEWQPHLIWMDIRMPVMDGFEATRLIRCKTGGEQVRIIALTASAYHSESKDIISCGFNSVLHKPFTAHDMFLQIEEFLGVKYRYRDDLANTFPIDGLAAIPGVESWASLSSESQGRLLTAALELNRSTIVKWADDNEREHPVVAAFVRCAAEKCDFASIVSGCTGGTVS